MTYAPDEPVEEVREAGAPIEPAEQQYEAEVTSGSYAQEATQPAAPSFVVGSIQPASQEPVSTGPSFKSDVISDQIWPAETQAPSPAEPQQIEAAEPEVSTRVEPVPPPPPPAIPEPTYTSEYSSPLEVARKYGVSEPELPIDVSEDERRLHNDARRFARLLVSEIKLYNEPKVQEGRSKGDLYDRLRDDIDRSRQMYDKRVAPPVAARHDYFHQELVNTLAEGDVNKLGMSYPGASPSPR